MEFTDNLNIEIISLVERLQIDLVTRIGLVMCIMITKPLEIVVAQLSACAANSNIKTGIILV